MLRMRGDEVTRASAPDSAHAAFPPATPTPCSRVIRVSRISSNEKTSGRSQTKRESGGTYVSHLKFPLNI